MNGIDRRQFIELGAESVAALALPRFATAADRAAESHPRYASFRPLPPGAIKPGGWLELYLQKQANQLSFHLPEVSWPRTDAY